MKFGVFYQLQALRPLDGEQWDEDKEYQVFQEALEQIEFADKLGFEYVFETEHHFLEEYSHSSAPEVFLAAASQRTKKMRLGHGIIQTPPRQNHPARVAERIATLDLVSNGRVEFGTGEGATTTEVGGFGTVRAEKKEAWEEATRETVRMLTMTPYPGFEGQHFSMPERNIIPKPRQKPHPPLWVAAGRRDSVMLGARLGMGALGFGFETPEEAEERVTRYYELIRGCRQPIGVAMNPALATVANMMMAPTDEEAIARGLRGAQYFGFALGHTNGRSTTGGTTSTAPSPSASRASTATRRRSPSRKTRRNARCSAPASAGASSAARTTCGRTCACTRSRTSTCCCSSCSAATASTSTSWNRWSCSRNRSCRVPGAPRAAPEVARAAARRRQAPHHISSI